MCGGGGNAAAAAQQQEAQRQAEISSNVNSINSAFTNRAPQYSQYLDATRKLYQTEVGRQQGIASRNLKFALARNGQTGGSVAADQGNELGREMAQGTIQAEQKAQGDLTKLQSQDQAQRLQMISLAQSGADIGNAATQTADALRANLGSAMAGSTANTVGDVFGNLSKNYENFQTAAMTRKGLANATQNIYGSQSTPATGRGPFE
jgi:hypothetical protein